MADDGEGCYFTKDGEKVKVTGADVEEHFKKAMSAGSDVVSAGPYNLTKFDAATGQATLDINPNYAGTVSYTHLDVYKRQDQDHPMSGPDQLRLPQGHGGPAKALPPVRFLQKQ